MPINKLSPSLSKIEPVNLALFVFGLVYFLFTHLYRLDAVPGLHFDEAWSANLSADIASGSLQEWRAQSAYTKPWSQILAAGFFQAFGTNLFWFRLASVASACLGILLLGIAIARAQFVNVACLLPLALASFSGLTLNHRFAIEITGFHVLCFGLFFFGVELRARRGPLYNAYLCIFMAAILGITSHILFLAPVVALLAYIVIARVPLLRTDRLLIMLLALVLTPFFANVLLLLPDKGKGIALVLFGVGTFLWALRGAPIPEFIEAKQKQIWKVITLLSLPFLFNAAVFSDGHWSYLLTHGGLVFPLFILLVPIAALLSLRRAYRSESFGAEEWFWLRYLSLVSLCAGAIMLKAAPRYYEIPMLCFAVAFAYAISKLEQRPRVVLAVVLVILSGTAQATNYFIPAFQGWTVEREHRFLFFKDSSRDFLSKQNFVRAMGERGCGLENLEVGDPRVLEALQFLARGDWPRNTAKNCGKFKIERRKILEEREAKGEKLSWMEKAGEVISDISVWSVR